MAGVMSSLENEYVPSCIKPSLIALQVRALVTAAVQRLFKKELLFKVVPNFEWGC